MTNASSLPNPLSRYHVMLASNSPRRKELLTMLGIDFDVVTTHDVDEVCPDHLPVTHRPEYLSILKASAYYPELKERDVLITADTMVIVDDKPLGKPTGRDEAIAMLRLLSGRTHKVVTGVTVCSRTLQVSFSVTTEVEFSPLTDDEITGYIDTFRPYDKAGAYGIQEWIGAIGIRGIHGSFYNVMGLPVHYLYNVLQYFTLRTPDEKKS